jgi:hypothetical protein
LNDFFFYNLMEGLSYIFDIYHKIIHCHFSCNEYHQIFYYVMRQLNNVGSLFYRLGHIKLLNFFPKLQSH